jgi:colicin import membrane protein
VAASFLLNALVFPADPIDIRSAIRVDVVGMPDKVEAPTPSKVANAPKVKLPEPAKPQPTPAKVMPPPKAEPKVNLNKAKSQQEQALERLKAMEAIERLKSEAAAEENEKKKAYTAAARQIKGNAVSAGNSLSGLDRIAFEQYFDDLQTHVKQHWNLPTWLASANLKGVVVVKIDARGFVLNRAISVSSNNQVFDNLVLETVDRASPFPPPPDRLKNVLQYNGFQLGFPE